MFGAFLNRFSLSVAKTLLFLWVCGIAVFVRSEYWLLEVGSARFKTQMRDAQVQKVSIQLLGYFNKDATKL